MDGKKTPVYVVDDEAGVRKALRRLISSFGYSVKTFADAESFLSRTDIGSEGVVVLDVNMPEMDGLVLQQKLIADSSPMKVIFITAYPDINDKRCALTCGAEGFLVKPFDDKRLLSLINKAATQEGRLSPLNAAWPLRLNQHRAKTTG